MTLTAGFSCRAAKGFLKRTLGVLAWSAGSNISLVRQSSFSFLACVCGQSLLETALVLPLLLLLALNAINFGYFFFVAVNLAAAPRAGVQYSIQGFSTPQQFQLPSAGPSTSVTSISFLTYADMTGVLPASSNTPVQVCTKLLGLNNPGTASQTANCAQYGTATTFPTPAPDPESPSFVLHRVDVKYTVQPLIPGGVFGITLLPSLTFHRQVSMRAMD